MLDTRGWPSCVPHVCAHMLACMYTCVYTGVPTCSCVYVCEHVVAHVCMKTRVCAHQCMCVHVCACLLVCTHKYICVCVCVCALHKRALGHLASCSRRARRCFDWYDADLGLGSRPSPPHTQGFGELGTLLRGISAPPAPVSLSRLWEAQTREEKALWLLTL